jgi:hypothetical protein
LYLNPEVCEFFFWRFITSLFTMTYGNDADRSLTMDDTRVNVEELKRMLSGEMDALVAKVADAMNTARAGRIIADSEEKVRDAHAEFRQQVFEKALHLLQAKQEAFSPSGPGTEEQGPAGHDASDDQRTRGGA